MTTTIEANMGSSVVVPGRGMLLNNELTDFTQSALDSEGLPNAHAPEGGKRPRRTALTAAERASLGGKRPRSSMAPTIVLEAGKPLLGIGSPGGSTIIGAVANSLSALRPPALQLHQCLASRPDRQTTAGQCARTECRERCPALQARAAAAPPAAPGCCGPSQSHLPKHR